MNECGRRKTDSKILAANKQMNDENEKEKGNKTHVITSTQQQQQKWEKEYRNEWYDLIIINLLYYTISIILHLFSSPHLFLYLESRDVHQSESLSPVKMYFLHHLRLLF